MGGGGGGAGVNVRRVQLLVSFIIFAVTHYIRRMFRGFRNILTAGRVRCGARPIVDV